MAEHYVESIVRTDKLRCSDCGDKIKKGDKVIFEIDDCSNKPMKNVYCKHCSENYQDQVDDCHPFSEDAFMSGY